MGSIVLYVVTVMMIIFLFYYSFLISNKLSEGSGGLLFPHSDYVIEWSESGTRNRFDAGLALKVEKEFKSVGKSKERVIVLDTHQLRDRRFKSRTTGKIYNVLAVQKRYMCGWFIRLVLDSNYPHSTILLDWKNINCMDVGVQLNISDHQYEFELLQ